MAHTKRAFLIHGWDGRAHNHWFPWLTKELEDEGFSVAAPAMPNPAHPKLSEWTEAIARAVGLPDADTYFVGHSLGCVTIAHYLAKLPDGVSVGGCVFVGGFSGSINEPEINEFYETALDIRAVKAHCPAFVSIASDDDDIVPFDASHAFSKELGGCFVAEHGKGHFTKSDGVTELPSARDAVLEISKTGERRGHVRIV